MVVVLGAVLLGGSGCRPPELVAPGSSVDAPPPVLAFDDAGATPSLPLPDTVRLALVGPADLLPAVAADVGAPSTVIVAGLLYDGLAELDADGGVRPALATSWWRRDDDRRWTFEVDAQRVSPDVVAEHLTTIGADPGLGPIISVERGGGTTIDIVLDRPITDLPARLAQLRYAVVAPGGQPTGRYRLAEPAGDVANSDDGTPDDEVTLVPVAAGVPTITIRWTASQADAYELLTLGRVDAAMAPPERLTDAAARFGHEALAGREGSPGPAFVSSPTVRAIGVAPDGTLDLGSVE